MHYNDPSVRLVVQALKARNELPEWVPTITREITLHKLFRKCSGDIMLNIYLSLIYMRDTHSQDPNHHLDNNDMKRLNNIIYGMQKSSVSVKFYLTNSKKNQYLSGEKLIWKGTTWPYLLLSWFTCSVEHWLVTSRRIDHAYGWCKASEDSVDIRRITDIKFHRNFIQFLLARSTLIIIVSEEQQREYRITTWGMKKVYENLRMAWLDANTNVAVNSTPVVLADK